MHDIAPLTLITEPGADLATFYAFDGNSDVIVCEITWAVTATVLAAIDFDTDVDVLPCNKGTDVTVRFQNEGYGIL